MLLAKLSDEEKTCFSSLVVNMLKPTYLNRYSLEYGIDIMENSFEFDHALSRLASIEEDFTKKAVFLELACVALCENNNQLEGAKRALLIDVATKFGIENVEEFISAAKELVPAQRKAFMLLGIW